MRVRELRKARRLSQQALVEKTKIYCKFLGGIERGQANPPLNVLSDIAGALGVGLPDLFTFDNVLADV